MRLLQVASNIGVYVYGIDTTTTGYWLHKKISELNTVPVVVEMPSPLQNNARIQFCKHLIDTFLKTATNMEIFIIGICDVTYMHTISNTGCFSTCALL